MSNENLKETFSFIGLTSNSISQTMNSIRVSWAAHPVNEVAKFCCNNALVVSARLLLRFHYNIIKVGGKV